MTDATITGKDGVAEAVLPQGFASLEPYVQQWCQESEQDRAQTRVSTPMPVLREFHGCVLPHLEDMIRHLNGLPNDPHALAPDARRLYQLALMVMEVSAPVDLEWESPDLDEAFPFHRIKFLPPSSSDRP
jgi:hypothetical protein